MNFIDESNSKFRNTCEQRATNRLEQRWAEGWQSVQRQDPRQQNARCEKSRVLVVMMQSQNLSTSAFGNVHQPPGSFCEQQFARVSAHGQKPQFQVDCASRKKKELGARKISFKTTR
jgi:hypothetical protein